MWLCMNMRKKFFEEFKLFQMFSIFSYFSTNLDFVYLCFLCLHLFTFVYLCLSLFTFVKLTHLCTNFVLVSLRPTKTNLYQAWALQCNLLYQPLLFYLNILCRDPSWVINHLNKTDRSCFANVLSIFLSLLSVWP